MSLTNTTPPRSRGRVAAGLVALAGIGASLLPGLATPASAATTPSRVINDGVVIAPEAYAYTDISASGTRLALNNIDDGAATVFLGFPLTSHTAAGTATQTGAQVQMSANGWAVVKTSTRSTKVFPVAGDWGLWSGNIYWSSTGDVGSRRFVAQFHDIAPFGARSNTATYQLVVDEGKPGIHVAYADSEVDVTPAPRVTVEHTEGTAVRTASLASAAPSGTQYRVDVTPPDTSAPSVTPAVTGASGRNGWHVGAPTVSWSVSDAQSPLLERSGCETQTVQADTSATGVTFTCTAASGGGASTQSVTLKRDTQAPTVAGTLSPAAADGKDGWYVSAPTLAVDCADAVPGSGLAACGTDGNDVRTKTFGEGAAPQTAAATASDVAGNSSATARASVRVDLADPVITCPAVPTHTYGSDADSLVATVSDGASGPTAAHVSRKPDTLVAPGRHTVELTASDVAGRTTTVACGYDVVPAPLTVTGPTVAKVYGERTPDLTPAVTGLVAGQTAAVLGDLSCSATGTGAGTHPVTCSGVSNAHYDARYVAGALTVTPAALLVQAPTHSRAYGQANPELVPSYAGFVAGESAAELSTPAVCSTDATTSSRTHDYAVVCTGATSRNYTITEVRGTLSVTPADVVVVGPSAGRLYGQANPVLAATVTGLVGDDQLAELACTTGATAASHVGSYATTCTAAPHADYSVKVVDGLLTVQKAPLTVSAPDARRTYGADNGTYVPTYTGFVNGDSVASLTAPATCTTAATSSSDVAAYPIRCEGAASTDYDLRYSAGTLTVTPAELVVTASDGERTYGAEDPAVTAGVVGLVAGDSLADLSGITCATTAAVDAPVGTHPTVCTGGESANYAVDHRNGVLTITPAGLVVSGPEVTKPYGGGTPVLAADYDGLVAGDSAADLSAVCTTAAGTSSPVGSYGVTCTGVADRNYQVSYAPGTLEVRPAQATVTARDADRTYGADTAALPFDVTGLVAGDGEMTGVTCTADAASSSPVGTYDITCNGATDGNYAVRYLPGVLTVTPAALTVVAPDATRPQGAANPALEPTYSGLAAGDAVADLTTPAFCTTDATAASPADTYAVICTGATSADYAVTHVDGVLTVEAPAEAPVLTAPTGTTVADATSPAGAKVGYSASAQASGRTVPVTCTKASGATFPIGKTTVTCQADGAEPVSFTVHTTSALEQMVALHKKVTGMGPGKSLEQQVEAAIKAKPHQVASALRTFQKHLTSQSGKSVSAAQAKDWTADADRIIAVLG